MDADKYASVETVAVKKWLQVAGVMPAVGEEVAVVVAAKNHVKKYPVSSFPGNKPIANQTWYLCP